MNREWELGPGVVGPVRYAELQALKERTASGVLGPGVTDPHPPANPHARSSDASLHVSRETPALGVSVDQLRRVVTTDPAFVAEYTAAELARPDQPRKTALKALLAVEAAKGDAADQALLGRLTAALEA